MLAIIGGSGLSQLAGLRLVRRQVVRTPYGEPSCPVTVGEMKGREIAFLARHGHGHTIAPHEINYRANLWALKNQGVQKIVSVAAVGGIPEEAAPGTLVVPHQIIDYTWGRKHTFFEGEAPVTHIDFTEPYTPALRSAILKAGASCGAKMIDGGVYACTQGPRLETAAEIDRLDRDGATVVGMTGMPEAGLARELGLAYAAIAVVANYAAGRGSSRVGVDLATIDEVLRKGMAQTAMVLENLVEALE